MSSIGRLSNCVVGGLRILQSMAELRVPTLAKSCIDYVRNDEGQWLLNNQILEDAAELERLKNLRIPPAWSKVTATTNIGAKVQAVGMDAAERWQYRILAEAQEASARKKFDRVKLFSKDMVEIRKGINKGIKVNDPRAYVLEIENRTAIRVGSDTDFKAKKKAYGLTTLQNEHVRVNGDKITFDFIAKEGLPAHYEIRSKKLAAFLKERIEKTTVGEKLFPDVNARKLNNYIKELAEGKKYSAKDFRTYHGTRIAFDRLKGYGGEALDVAAKKKLEKEVLKEVSDFLHNTPVMAKKSYIDPMVWDFIKEK